MKSINGIKSLCLIALLVLIISACKYSIISEVFIGDIFAVSEGKEKVLQAKANIKVAMPSSKECKQRSKELVENSFQVFQ